MQTKKDYIREQIAAAAKVVFLRKGFVKTSMRDIAKESNQGVSNIYNYFESKDVLFHYIVQPLIKELETMVREHHSARYHTKFLQYATGEDNVMILEQMKIYLRLLDTYRDELKLLLFKAQGSSLENFIDEYTDECTRLVVKFMEGFQRKYPQFTMVQSPFTYHVHTVWMFSFITEIIKHQLEGPELEKAIKDYMDFEYIGWRLFLNQQ